MRLATSLAHLGANVTGCSSRAADLEAKRLQLLKELVPGLSRVAILFNYTNQFAIENNCPPSIPSASHRMEACGVIHLVHCECTRLGAPLRALQRKRKRLSVHCDKRKEEDRLFVGAGSCRGVPGRVSAARLCFRMVVQPPQQWPPSRSPCAIRSEAYEGQAAHGSIQNDSGLPQGPTHLDLAGWTRS
jgi:hypothetical protein